MTPDQVDQIVRSARLQVHSQDLALTRMYIVTLEAMGTALGWNVDLLEKWTAYNAHLMMLQVETRKLLAF